MNVSLTLNDVQALGPLLALLVFMILVLLVDTFSERISKKYIPSMTLAGIVTSIALAYTAPTSISPLLTPWLAFDSVARFFTMFFLGVGAVAVLIAISFFRNFALHKGEFYFLLLATLFGLILISSSNDFLTLFIGLETLSITLYVLTCFMKSWEISHEAAIKYFLLGAIAASFLLFGIALVYGAIGSTGFTELAKSMPSLNGSHKMLCMAGLSLITLGLLFKAAVVPFHMWAPDVYAGASTPVTAYMSVATKAAAFSALIRIFLLTIPHFDPVWNSVVSFFAYMTLIYANFVAMRQVQFRAFFAYSGISHAGFLLIPLISQTPESVAASLFYLVVYAVATLGSFAVLTVLDTKQEGVMLHDVKGLFRTSPILACIFSLCLLTLGGIPPTIGFFAKFYLFKIAYAGGYYGLIIVGLVTSVLSAYYYLRPVALMFSEKPEKEIALIRSWPTLVACYIALVLLVLFVCYPDIALTLCSA